MFSIREQILDKENELAKLERKVKREEVNLVEVRKYINQLRKISVSVRRQHHQKTKGEAPKSSCRTTRNDGSYWKGKFRTKRKTAKLQIELTEVTRKECRLESENQELIKDIARVDSSIREQDSLRVSRLIKMKYFIKLGIEWNRPARKKSDRWIGSWTSQIGTRMFWKRFRVYLKNINTLKH